MQTTDRIIGVLIVVLLAIALLLLKTKPEVPGEVATPVTSPTDIASPRAPSPDPEALKKIEERYPQHITPIPDSDQAWFEIPEMGVRLKFGKDFAHDLVYERRESNAIFFSTKKLLATAPECTPDTGPLGYVGRKSGNADVLAATDAWVASRLPSLMQIGDYFYFWEAPQTICWDNAHNDAVKQNVPGLFSSKIFKIMSDALKTMDAIPEQSE